MGDPVRKILDPDTTLNEKHAAFERIVIAFQDMAFAVAYAILGDFHSAEDAAQQAFITAWQKIHQLREPDAFPGWFKRIVVRECSRMTRRRRPLTTSSDQPIAHFDDPQKKLESAELRRTVFAAIKGLPLNERIVVALFYLQEQSHADIGAFLDLPRTTVAKRLYSARVRLEGTVMSGFKKDISRRRPSRNASFAKKVRDGLYDEYIGRYKFDLRPELVVTITREGERLFSESSAGQRNELSAPRRRSSELVASEFDGRGRFIRDRAGRISHLVYYEFGKEMGIARKVA